MGLHVPKYEPVAFAIEETGDTGSFTIDTTRIATKIYKLAVPSDEDQEPFAGVALHLSLAVSGGDTNCEVEVAAFGSLDGTTADTMAHGGTFAQTVYTILNLGIMTHKVTRVFELVELGPYFGFFFEENGTGNRTIECTASARRFRYRDLIM